MTSAIDNQTHTITIVEFDAGMRQGRGIYRVACGQDVVAASLVVGPGRQCVNCSPLLEESEPARVGRLRTILASLPGLAAPENSTEGKDAP